MLVGIVVAGVVEFRHRFLVFGLSLAGAPPLLPAQDEGPHVRWVDDYFTVEAIDERTFAIGEPRYAQSVYNYLILGEERAILFDAGPGLRDIRSLAESLTDLPITFVITNNKSYRILKQRLQAFHGSRDFVGMDFNNPEIDFANIARSLGVTAETITDPDAIRPALDKAIASRGPTLLDVVVDGTV